MLHTRLFTKLTPTHQQAGFAWPRYMAFLPAGPLAKRLADRKRPPCCGDYITHGHPITEGGHPGGMFYLDSDFMPGLRWQWADEVVSLRHEGWYCDEDGFQTIRGLVFRLPHGRGFLAGWSMGKSMASHYEGDIYEDEEQAAYAADSMAEQAAERQREFEEEERERFEAEEAEIDAERQTFPVSTMGV